MGHFPLFTVSLCQLNSTAVLYSPALREPQECHLWGIWATADPSFPPFPLPLTVAHLPPRPLSPGLASSAAVLLFPLAWTAGCDARFLLSLHPSKPWKQPGKNSVHYTRDESVVESSCSGNQAHRCACWLLGWTQLPAAMLVHEKAEVVLLLALKSCGDTGTDGCSGSALGHSGFLVHGWTEGHTA